MSSFWFFGNARRLQLPPESEEVVSREAVESPRIMGIGVGLFVLIMLLIFQCGSCLLAPQLFRTVRTQ